MDGVWGMMRGVAKAADAPTSIRRGTVPRIWRFARPYRRLLLGFLSLTVVSATVGVLTPVLAGRVVDTIIRGGPDAARTVVLPGAKRGSVATRSNQVLKCCETP